MLYLNVWYTRPRFLAKAVICIIFPVCGMTHVLYDSLRDQRFKQLLPGYAPSKDNNVSRDEAITARRHMLNQCMVCLWFYETMLTNGAIIAPVRGFWSWFGGVCSLTYCNGNFRVTMVSEPFNVIL